MVFFAVDLIHVAAVTRWDFSGSSAGFSSVVTATERLASARQLDRLRAAGRILPARTAPPITNWVCISSKKNGQVKINTLLVTVLAHWRVPGECEQPVE
ncbi:hypothetical protein [Actinosynnema sp. ALI-1.44]|uniref:hypothetical protein n=1 Tax=Actinosynnema sp. ALI-1.44 TaxID=1933779 RepID=UPI00117738A3|nr:hypothetical protein [Actinosynnema sp. ALI-1.44]